MPSQKLRLMHTKENSRVYSNLNLSVRILRPQKQMYMEFGIKFLNISPHDAQPLDKARKHQIRRY